VPGLLGALAIVAILLCEGLLVVRSYSNKYGYKADGDQMLFACGVVILVYRTPDWEDFVCPAVTEIRRFGGTSIQVARRLPSFAP
jgi:hypothetical protein